MSWNPNWDTSEGMYKVPSIGLNELRLALIERTEVCGRTISSDIIEIGDDNVINPNWFTAFQLEITRLWTYNPTNPKRFIRHNINQDTSLGVTFYDYSTWDESTMLTEIGDDSRLSAPNDPQICGPWMFQQKKILNELRWVFGAFVNPSTNAFSYYQKSSYQGSPSWPSTWSVTTGSPIDHGRLAVSKSGSNWSKARKYTNRQGDLLNPNSVKGKMALFSYVQAWTNFRAEVYPSAGYYVTVIDSAQYGSGDSFDFDLLRIDSEPASRVSDGTEGWSANNNGVPDDFVMMYDGDEGFEYLDII